MDSEGIKKTVATQATYAAVGGAIGAATKHAIQPQMGQRIPMAAQVGSAVGAAARNGAGAGGAIAAGGAVIAAKAAAVGTAVVAAAPIVGAIAVVGGTIYGVKKLIDYLDS